MTACNGRACLSHALNETAEWYNDCLYMTTAQYPWSARGGSYVSKIVAGVFGSAYGSGIGSDASIRLVLSAN